ncbi:MAG: carbohydrate kinase family protein [Bacteroidota bacterium]|jgi:sugar/nucleoside kinase (ribokinase family)
MKITLIGHLCIDVFHQADGTEVQEFGGIYHAVAAMANLASDRDALYPVFGVGADHFERVMAAFSVYKNVNTNGIFRFEGETNSIHYYADGSGERSVAVAKPIEFSRIKNSLSVDGVYINMISGNDITVDTIDEIRLEVRAKKVPIHLDMHCLTMQVNPDGTRLHTPLPDWRRWCFMTDSVQMNETEAAIISAEKFSNELLAKQMIPLMVKAFVITRGDKGCTLYQAEHKQLLQNDFPGEKIEEPESVIGSGDIFGASFLLSYIKKKTYGEAARFAVKAAGVSTQFSVREKHRHLTEVK